MSKPVTRILSDLHYGDPASWVTEFTLLRPLFEGAERVVVNGDALDTQVLARPGEVVARLKAFFAEHTAEATFVTGNHDPDISDLHELSLEQDQVWLTHGDVLFDDIAPWGCHAGELRRRIRALATHLSSTELARLEHRFPIFRKACLALPREHDPDARGRIAGLLRMAKAVFPPHRVLAMMRAWRTMPGLAAALARAQRPNARIIVIGHTHSPGIWPQPDGRVVINTGCFCPPRGGQVVDVTDEQVTVRRFERKHGAFHLGERVASLPLPRTRVAVAS